MSSLAELHCERCSPGTTILDLPQANQFMAQLHSAWSRNETWLSRRIEFKNFHDAFAAAAKIALLAEQQAHHPDLEIGWGYLNIRLTTHAAKGLTENDFIMAAKIDTLTS